MTAAVGPYTKFGGVHPETAALRNMLTFHGVRSPLDGEPLSEALLLGIGGGIGGGYWVFEFEGIPPAMALGARNDWQLSPGLFVAKTAERLGLDVNVRETTGRKGAEKHLAAVLDAGQPAAVAVDMASVPHTRMPPEAIKYYYHLIVVTARDGEVVTVDDRAGIPLTMAWDELNGARGAITSMKHRMVTVRPPATLSDAVLTTAIEAGLNDCVHGLLEPPIRNFGLPAWEKWAGMIANTKDRKGWPAVFPPGPKLFSGLRSTMQWIEAAGNGPGMLRAMYAEFLREAGTITNRPQLHEIAVRYDTLAGLWSDLARAALPDEVPALGETRELLLRRESAFRTSGAAAADEIDAIDARLAEIDMAMEHDFPLDAAASHALLEELRERILVIHAAEVGAATELRGLL